MAKQVLVTGSNGYIAHSLLKSNPKYDFTSKHTSQINVNGYDTVVHLAEKKLHNITADNIDNLIADQKQFIDKITTQKLIYVSSCSVYGRQDLCAEGTEHQPTTNYAYLKSTLESYIANNVQNYTIIRFGTVFGVNENTRWDLLINKILWAKLNNQTIDLFDLHSYRPYIHVADCATALEFTIENNLTGIFNVASFNATKKEIIDTVQPNYISINGTDARDYRVVADKIRQQGFVFDYDLQSGLEKSYSDLTQKTLVYNQQFS